MKLLVSVLVLMSLFAAAGDFVFKVSDGDTIHLVSDAGVRRKVRLAKIDAPELNQDRGAAAADHLAALVLGKVVEVESFGRDRYGRSLDVVYRQIDSTNRVEVNLQMVRDGYAWHYARFDQTPAYIEAEKAARERRLGIWGDPHPVNPQEYRREKNSPASDREYGKRTVKIPEKYLKCEKHSVVKDQDCVK